MALNWKIHRSFIILIAVATAVWLFGVMDGMGYPMSYQIFGGITIKHVIALAQLYVGYIVWKRYV